MTKINGKKVALAGKQCGRDEFYKYLDKTVLKQLDGIKDTEYLKSEMEKGTFLPKQTVKENGTIPYQVHLYELDRILKHLGSRIPLLSKEREKILQIFTFRIPYYVGPLNGIKHGKDATNWAVRKDYDQKEKNKNISLEFR